MPNIGFNIKINGKKVHCVYSEIKGAWVMRHDGHEARVFIDRKMLSNRNTRYLCTTVPKEEKEYVQSVAEEEFNYLKDMDNARKTRR